MAAEINQISVTMKDTRHIVVAFSGEQIVSSDISIFEISGENPRIVVDINDSQSILLKNGAYTEPYEQYIRGIRGANRSEGDMRFVVDLLPGSELKDKIQNENKISIVIQGAFAASQPVISQPVSSQPVLINAGNLPPQPDTSNIPTPRVKPKPISKPIIVIDAGHGGRDPGALGGSGLQEKSVTLKAAKELKTQLLATGRYQVVLSREDDRYVEHDDRLRIARARNADLFISIHADATAGKTARGASVYTLADRAKSRSKRIVNNQNWIMDVNLSEQNSDVGNILVDLAQRNTASQSTKFADILISNLGQSTPLIRNTHRRAGYYVLLAPDVPAVLLELGFISNPEDEKLLKSESHRQRVMGTVTTAINQYFDGQKP